MEEVRDRPAKFRQRGQLWRGENIPAQKFESPGGRAYSINKHLLSCLE